MVDFGKKAAETAFFLLHFLGNYRVCPVNVGVVKHKLFDFASESCILGVVLYFTMEAGIYVAEAFVARALLGILYKSVGEF